MSRIAAFLAGAALLVGAGAANAEEPITLTDAQMDNVRAGITLARTTEVTDPETGLITTEVSSISISIRTALFEING